MTKKKTFSLFALLLGILLAFPVAGCGDDNKGDAGNSDNGGNNDGGDDKLTASNWQDALKDKFGVDLPIAPAGWSFAQGDNKTITANYPEYELYFTTDAADFAAAYDEFVNAIFDATEQVTPADGNYDAKSIGPFEKGDRFESVPTIEVWYFSFGTSVNQVVVNSDEATKMAAISIMRGAGTKTW